MPKCKICREATTQRFGLIFACGLDHATQYQQMQRDKVRAAKVKRGVKRKAATKAERLHMGAMAATGCIICDRPTELHHPRHGTGMGQRASNYNVIPLCEKHHRTGGPGIALHAGIKTFESTFGTEPELLEKALKRLENYA